MEDKCNSYRDINKDEIIYLYDITVISREL